MQLEIAGPAGTLVGELESPQGTPRGCAVVCHPHPLHGGSLRNTIVVRTARALRAHGLVTLRFNFRGVEGSAGVHDGAGEIEDAAAAVSYLRGAHPGLPQWAAGYSFGSRIVAELAARDAGLERLILIAFPAKLYDPSVLLRLGQPALLLLAGADAFGTSADLPPLPPSLELVEIEGADHFFRGRTPLVEQAVDRYARAALSGTGQS